MLQAPDAAVAPKAKARIEHGQDIGASTTAVAEPDAVAEDAVTVKPQDKTADVTEEDSK